MGKSGKEYASHQAVSLGCGTLIIIALLVLFLGRADVKPLKAEVASLRQEIAALRAEAEWSRAALTAIASGMNAKVPDAPVVDPVSPDSSASP